jgi:glutamate/tyrosine decarboxylase-like PLP-dependent enzyme
VDGRIVSAYTVLDVARDLAHRYLDGVARRHVGGTAPQAALRDALGGPLPEDGAEPARVLEQLARSVDPGLVASAGPRYFGFVTGGAVPVTVGADWLASAWDQNGSIYVMSPVVAVLEDIVARWLVELLRLPAGASVGFVTGCHMANFTCLAAARHDVLRRAGWNVEADGLQRAPRITVFVGDEVHISAVGGLRLLGFGTSELVRIAADGQGRMSATALEAAMAQVAGPAIVCAQVGNVSTGASDPIGRIVDIAHARDAWVHVDGAFGLWASAVAELRDQVSGVERADSWATDAHKWLNVPYDSGLAIVSDPAPHRAAMGLHASYFQRGADEERVGMDWVPESSRRSRVIPIYALLRALGARGIRDMVARTCRLARRMAARLTEAPGVRVINEVALNQVLVQFDGDAGVDADETTRRVIAAVQAEGTCWAGGAVWQGRHVMRISISNWSTTDADIDRSAAAILACHGALVAGRLDS